MADAPDLGSGPVRGGGSSPLSRTNFQSNLPPRSLGAGLCIAMRPIKPSCNAIQFTRGDASPTYCFRSAFGEKRCGIKAARMKVTSPPFTMPSVDSRAPTSSVANESEVDCKASIVASNFDIWDGGNGDQLTTSRRRKSECRSSEARLYD
jgi:hypothetical protein